MKHPRCQTFISRMIKGMYDIFYKNMPSLSFFFQYDIFLCYIRLKNLIGCQKKFEHNSFLRHVQIWSKFSKLISDLNISDIPSKKNCCYWEVWTTSCKLDKSLCMSNLFELLIFLCIVADFFILNMTVKYGMFQKIMSQLFFLCQVWIKHWHVI